MTHLASSYLNGGVIASRYGTGHGSIVPYQVQFALKFYKSGLWRMIPLSVVFPDLLLFCGNFWMLISTYFVRHIGGQLL